MTSTNNNNNNILCDTKNNVLTARVPRYNDITSVYCYHYCYRIPDTCGSSSGYIRVGARNSGNNSVIKRRRYIPRGCSSAKRHPGVRSVAVLSSNRFHRGGGGGGLGPRGGCFVRAQVVSAAADCTLARAMSMSITRRGPDDRLCTFHFDAANST